MKRFLQAEDFSCVTQLINLHCIRNLCTALHFATQQCADVKKDLIVGHRSPLISSTYIHFRLHLVCQNMLQK